MDSFKDFFWYLLTSPLKKVEKSRNAWWILSKVVGELFDKVIETFHLVRDETMAATCSDSMLPYQAADRGMDRYLGEDDENFRKRIVNYPDVCQLGGTEIGILLAVENLGFDGHSIVLAKILKNDPERWAEFYILLPFGVDDLLPIGANILKKVVRNIKETGAKDNYQFQFSSEAEYAFKTSCVYKVIHRCYPRPDQPILLLDGRWQMNGEYELSDFMNASMEDYPLYLDGTWELSGHYRLSGYQIDQLMDLYPVTIKAITETKVSVQIETILDVKKDLWYLDGTECLDGKRSLSANITQYKL